LSSDNALKQKQERKNQFLQSFSAAISRGEKSMFLERSTARKCIDFVTFPLRAPFAIPFGDNDKFGVSSLQTERFDYVAKEVRGYCLDIGCGPDNRFVTRYLKGNGIGIDVIRQQGLSDENVVQDMTHLPFSDSVFDSVTFIANFNHIPRPICVAELAEARRCLKHGGNVIVTAVTPLAWIIVHKVGFLFEVCWAGHEVRSKMMNYLPQTTMW
jgi:SAM-dependent methyltransferase